MLNNKINAILLVSLFIISLAGCGAGGVDVQTSGTGSNAQLVAISVTPTNPTIAKNTSQQFTAIGTYSDNTTQDLTASVTWSSSDTSVATVSTAADTSTDTTTAVSSNGGGHAYAYGKNAGKTTITATSGSTSGSTTLTVTSATLVSLTVTPANPSIAKGITQQFAAAGTFSDNTTQDLTTQVTWNSSNTGVAAINASGSATSVVAGSTTITATSGSISGSTNLTVTSATLISIAITPVNPSIAKGTTQQFTATGTFSDATTQNLTTSVAWSSSNTGVAAINASGLATSVAAGSTTITATSGSILGSTSLTVTPATLVSISVTPSNPSIAQGATQQFIATGTFSDGSTQSLTTTATWSSSNASVAAISNVTGSKGLATAVAAGTTTIRSTSSGVSATAALGVTAITTNTPNIVNAASCSQSNVQTAVDSAGEGDLVAIPAGSCTWTGSVSISKGITVQGKGKTSTIINANNARLFNINISGKNFRISQIGFTGSGTSSYVGIIMIEGSGASFRIDNCSFANTSSRMIVIGYSTSYTVPMDYMKGLIDHNSFATAGQSILIYGKSDSWLDDDAYGTDNAIFVEDNTFTFPTAGTGSDTLDCEGGVRFVYRHNQITNGIVAWHDTGSTQQKRSTRLFEIYNNAFTCTVSNCGWTAINVRGGTGAIYNNTISNQYETAGYTMIKRLDTAYAQGMGQPWVGAYCDSTFDRICSDFRSHCSGGSHHYCNSDSNCSAIGEGTCTINACTDDSQCGSGNTCLTKMDGQLDLSGWPCRDQTGRGKDDPITHVQASSPLYWWNNKDQNGNTWHLTVPSENVNYIQPNRDYCEHDPSTSCGSVAGWTYAPYTYPHPLSTP